jgi:23S rRNA (uridine2552-2'-O)-methyltransferase
LPSAWIRERKRDYYYRLAKQEQYRSRAAYKLLEAVEKYGFIKPGDVVVDLGAAPGGWTQVSRKIVGETGFVLGVDLKAIEPFTETNVRSVVGDLTESETIGTIRELLPRAADAVLSDVSPNVSGIWEVDHARQVDLARKSLQIAVSVLRVGGNFFVKVFQGDMLNDFVYEMRQCFDSVRFVKPKASRRKSAELFVLGLKKLG